MEPHVAYDLMWQKQPPIATYVRQNVSDKYSKPVLKGWPFTSVIRGLKQSSKGR